MTELQGAVALAQLQKLEEIVARRRKWCQALSQALQDVSGIALPQPTQGCAPSWWFYLLRVEPEILGVDADTFAGALRAEGLPVSAHYIGKCVYAFPVFNAHTAFAHGGHAYETRSYGPGLCPVAEEILKTAVLLSINEAYTETDLTETIYAIRRTARWFARQSGRR
jgi:dTDP-4-amino-4,6-dideoxygalactose transaminase